MAFERKHVDIFTDGACTGNPGVGGWACILLYKKAEKRLSGAEPCTTNNRMEMTALIEAIKCLKESCEVTVYSDSSYVINGFTQGWLENWMQHGFKKSDGKPVLNVDLWQELYNLTRHQYMSFKWVRGHADNELNNACDRMAVQAYRDYIEAHKEDAPGGVQYERAPGDIPPGEME